MKNKLRVEELYLMELLQQALSGEGTDAETGEVTVKNGVRTVEEADYGRLLVIASKHAVLSLLYDVLQGEKLSPKEQNLLSVGSRRVVQSSYRLLLLTAHLARLMEERGIVVAVLKGAGTSALYPVPELRKSGDIDLLLPKSEQMAEACGIMEELGFQKEGDQHSNHHVGYIGPAGIVIELHEMFAEAFDNKETNTYLQKVVGECAKHISRREVMGITLPVLDTAYDAFYLLLHMLHHFLRAGFGLKLLCDWVVFWNRDMLEGEECLLRLLKESGLSGFARLISAVCIKYLGLKEEKIKFLLRKKAPVILVDTFLEEILEAEEFGQSQPDRMVMMRGSGLVAYFREFHHQMKVNYPKAGRVPPLWPILWIMTLCVFIYNNRKLRKVSSMDILRKAGKRSELIKEIKLFDSK